MSLLWLEGPRKNFFLDRPIPLISGSGWPPPLPPPLIWRFGFANAGTLQRPSNFPITIVASVASGIIRLNQPTYIISPKVQLLKLILFESDALFYCSSNWTQVEY